MENLSIQIFTTLPDELKQQTEELRFIAFHKQEHTEKQKALFADKYVFEEGSFAYVIAYAYNKPVGYMRLFKRRIHFDKNPLLLGGIGGVCTAPAYQHQGIATKMLQRAVEKLKKENCDIAFLCTDIEKLHTLYRQVGFVPLNKAYTSTGKSGHQYTDFDGMIAPINSQALLEEVLQSNLPFHLEGQAW